MVIQKIVRYYKKTKAKVVLFVRRVRRTYWYFKFKSYYEANQSINIDVKPSLKTTEEMLFFLQSLSNKMQDDITVSISFNKAN